MTRRWRDPNAPGRVAALALAALTLALLAWSRCGLPGGP